MQGAYKGNNEIIRDLVQSSWMQAKTVNEYQIAIAGLTAAQAMSDNESDRAELQNLIDLAHKFIREITTGVDEA